MKGYIPLLPQLLKEQNTHLQLATLKSLGIFTCQAAIVPLRMQVFFKDVKTNGVVKEVCEIFKSGKGNKVTAIE